MSIIERFMILRSGKTIRFSETEKEAFEIIARDLDLKKDFKYAIHDLDNDVNINPDEYISDLKFKTNLEKQKKKSKSKPKSKPNDIVDDKYSAWLGTQPCIVTGQTAKRGAGQYDMHCHHVYGRRRGRNDYCQVPLIGYVHSWGSKSYHSCGNSDFINYWGLAVADLIIFFEGHAKRLNELNNKKS